MSTLRKNERNCYERIFNSSIIDRENHIMLLKVIVINGNELINNE